MARFLEVGWSCVRATVRGKEGANNRERAVKVAVIDDGAEPSGVFLDAVAAKQVVNILSSYLLWVELQERRDRGIPPGKGDTNVVT